MLLGRLSLAQVGLELRAVMMERIYPYLYLQRTSKSPCLSRIIAYGFPKNGIYSFYNKELIGEQEFQLMSLLQVDFPAVRKLDRAQNIKTVLSMYLMCKPKRF